MVKLLNHNLLQSFETRCGDLEAKQLGIYDDIFELFLSLGPERPGDKIMRHAFPFTVETNPNDRPQDIRKKIDRAWDAARKDRTQIWRQLERIITRPFKLGTQTQSVHNKFADKFDRSANKFLVQFNDRVWSEWVIKTLKKRERDPEESPEELHRQMREFFLKAAGCSSKMRVVVYKNLLISAKCIGDNRDLAIMIEDFYRGELEKLNALRSRYN